MATNTDVLMVLSGVGDVVMVKVAVAIRKKGHVTCILTNQKLCQGT